MNLHWKNERVVSREISVQNQEIGRKFTQEDLDLLLKSSSINIHSILTSALWNKTGWFHCADGENEAQGVPTSTGYKAAPQGSTPYLLAGGTQVGDDFEVH